MITLQKELRSLTITSGVYGIQNVKTHESYIGASKNIPKRIGEHLTMLRNNKHHSPLFQESYNRHSESDFVVLILDKCDPSRFDKIEQMFIDCMGSLNRSKFSKPGKIPRTEEQKRHISEKLKGKTKSIKGKTYLEIYGTSEPKCGFKKGVKLEDSVYQKLSETTKQAWAVGKLKGFKKSEETKRKMAESRRLYWERKRNENNTNSN